MNYTLKDIKVFIPTYNRPKYLRQSIESLVNQSAGCPDITVYNNGTLQETSDVIKEFEQFGVKEVKSKGGLLECMNSVQEYIDTPYVMFFHDDDVLNCKYLEYALRALNTYKNISLITTKYNEFKDFKTIDFVPAKEEHYFFSSQKDFSSYLYLFERVAMQTAIYKTELFKKYPRENDKYGKFFDWPYLVTLSGLGNVVLFSDENIFNVRIHKAQWTYDEKSSWTILQLINWHKQFADAIDITNNDGFGTLAYYSKFYYFIKSQYQGLVCKNYQEECPFDELLEKAHKEIGLDSKKNIYNKTWIYMFLQSHVKEFNWREHFNTEIKPKQTISFEDIIFAQIQKLQSSIEILKNKNQLQLQQLNNKLDKIYEQNYALNIKVDFLADMLHKPTLLQKFFSIRNEGTYKILRIFGIKIKFERGK